MIDRSQLVEWAPRAAIAAVSGWSLCLLVAPFDHAWLHWVVYLPMLWALSPDSPRQNALNGWIYGIVGVGSIFVWIAQTIILFSNIPAIGAYAIVGLFAAVFSWSYPVLWGLVHPLRRRLGDGWILAIPALQVVLEYTSSFVLLFPYNHGVSQYRNPYTWQIVSITGVWGLSYLVFFFNCAFAEAIFRAREGRPPPIRWMAAAVATLSVVVIYGAIRFDQIEAMLRAAPTLRVAQIQTGMSMDERLSHPAREAFDDWRRRTQAIPPHTVDLVVWPEGASPYSLQTPKVAALFAKFATDGGYEMIVGSGARERVQGTATGSKAFNTIYHVSRDGKITGHYNKMVPLPFGEYMPLAKTPFAPLVSWIEGPGDFEAGTEPIVLGTDGHWKFATPICYEAILERTCREFADYDVLVNVTNDAWFGNTAAPHQHAMLAAVRATELGAPLIRAGYTGVSFVVEPNGHIYAETTPFTDVAQIATVRMGKVPTLYARFGDWFVVLCAVGLVLGLSATRDRKAA